ncbi:MAG: COG4223 family protein, partial [Alsobacter sp.]
AASDNVAVRADSPPADPGAQSAETGTADGPAVRPDAEAVDDSTPPRTSATAQSDPDARRSVSAPSVPITRSGDRQGYMGPATAGLIGGLVGAGILAAGLFAFGPAGDLGDRLSAMESALGDKATRRNVEAVDKRASTVEAALQSVRSDVDKLSGRPAPPDIGPVNSRIDRLERRLAEVASRPAEPATGPALPAPPPRPAAAPETARLAVSMLVRDAVSRGAPYGNEIAALETAGADPQAVARLKPFAQTGAPTPAKLAADFAPLGEKLARAPQPSSDGVMDRISATLSRVVKVRPVGNAQGEDSASIAARAETALRRGDLAAALEALQRLPEADRRQAQPFIDTLTARVAAGQAADALVARGVDDVLAVLKTSGVPAR